MVDGHVRDLCPWEQEQDRVVVLAAEVESPFLSEKHHINRNKTHEMQNINNWRERKVVSEVK